MEENKKDTVNTVKEGTKPTYDQLKDWCNQLLMQRNQVAEKLDQITNIVNKLPWLFKVVESKNVFPSEFVQSCADEIMFILTPPTEEEQKEESNDNKE